MHVNIFRYTLSPMSVTTLIDSHCHLDFDVFDEDREQVIQRAQDNNIKHIIVPGTKKVYWEKINDLCAQYKQLHPCYGLHPYWINEHKKEDIDALDKYIENNTPIAVGECGLDFRNNQVDRTTQLYFFEAQLALAQKYQLPVVIHSVKATETVINTIKKFKGLTGMIHSYSGSLEQAKQLIDLGYYISIGGSVTYDNAKKTKSIVQGIPLTSLLLETDAPDQPDKTNKNTRNEPAYLIHTLDIIAKLKNTEQEKIAKQTTDNAITFFNL